MRGPLSLQTFLPDPDGSAPADPDEYRLHLPPNCAAGDPRPLILAFHGAFSSPEEMAEESSLDALADREGLIVVYPRGSGFLGLLQHWNSGHCCGPANEGDVDDVAFTHRVMAAVDRRAPVDWSRVYIVGMSNGAMMVHRVASEMSDVVAAAAAISGTVGGSPAEGEQVWRITSPSRPVPMLLMHGDADQVVPWDGGIDPIGSKGRTFLSVAESVDFWRSANGTFAEPRTDSLRRQRITRSQWQGAEPASEVVLYRVAEWPHAWPGGKYTRDLPSDDAMAGFEAVEEVWSFLSRHSHRPAHRDPGTMPDTLTPCGPVPVESFHSHDLLGVRTPPRTSQDG
ncbi:MAG: PHB depolymerase family esterase [Candidatus Binatia bacterium]|nr:PHB depolymerase family esterase [Candidatus Binatia bacterium]